MLKWIVSLFKSKPKEEKICDCGCGVSLKMLPYNHDVHDTNLILNKGPVSEKAQAFCDSIKPAKQVDDFHGADSFSCVYRGPGGPGCGD